MSTNIFKKAQARNQAENEAALEAQELAQEPAGYEVPGADEAVEAGATDAPDQARAEEAAETVEELSLEDRIARNAARRATREEPAGDREADRVAKARERAESSAKRIAEEAFAVEQLETRDLHERAARLEIRSAAVEADHVLAMEIAHEAALKAARSGDHRDEIAAEHARAAEIDAYYVAREMKALAENAEREARARDLTVAEKAGEPVDRAAFDAAKAEEISRQMDERNAHEAEVASARKRTSEAVAAIKMGKDAPSTDAQAPAETEGAARDQSAAAKLAALKAEIEKRKATAPAVAATAPAAGADAQSRAEALEKAASQAGTEADRAPNAAELGRVRQEAAIARTEAELEEAAASRAAKEARDKLDAEFAEAMKKSAAEQIEAEAKARAEQARQEVYRVVNEVSARANKNNEGIPTEEQLEKWVAEAVAKIREEEPGVLNGDPEAGEGEPEGAAREPFEMSPEARRVLLAYLGSRLVASELREAIEGIDAERARQNLSRKETVAEALAPTVEQIRALFHDVVPVIAEADPERLRELEERIAEVTEGLREQVALRSETLVQLQSGLRSGVQASPQGEPVRPAAAPSAAALDLVQSMMVRAATEGLPSARAHEERLLEAGIAVRDEEPTLDQDEAPQPKSIRPEAAWLLRAYMNVRQQTAATIEALDAAAKAQPNMADQIKQGREAIMRGVDALGVDVARALSHPDDQETSLVQTRLSRFEVDAARRIDDLTRGMTPEALAAAAAKAPAPTVPQGLEGAEPFKGSDAESLDDDIGLGGHGMIVNGDPEPAQPSRLAPSKAGDAFSSTPGDVIPPRPHSWPIVMAWPPHQYMQALAAPEMTAEKRQKFWDHLVKQTDPMMERAAQIDEWIRSQRGRWNLRDRNPDDRFARTHSIGDPYRGVRWALLLENKPIKAQGVNLWGHSRAYLADGGVVAARHDGVNVRKVSDQAVKLAMQESLARGYGSLKISGTKEFCMKAAELARAAGIEAEISYGGFFGLGLTRKIKVMPHVPDPIVLHAGTENEAKTPGTPEYEGRQAARQLDAQIAEREAAEREVANRLPEPRPTSSTRRRDPQDDPMSSRDDDLLERQERSTGPRPKTYAEIEDGSSPLEMG